MLLCPISGLKLVSARAKGGTFWYSPHSRGRLLTLEMAKHFLGDDGAREIWVRSELTQSRSENPCPSCTKVMRRVSEPGWLGGGKIDVCRGCHFIWIDPDAHPEVPHPEDLIVPQGDSTLVKDRREGATAFLIQKEKAQFEREQTLGEGPDSILGSLPAFLGLPVEIESPGRVGVPWLTIALTFVMLLFQFAFAGGDWVRAFGFYPARPLEHAGLNIFTSVLLHSGWIHLIGNLYFFWMFSDDVEGDLGRVGFLGFFAFCSILIALVTTGLSGQPDVPHVGLSGIVMALMVYYALQFPKARIAYLLPMVRSLPYAPGAVGIMPALRWARLPVWFVAVAYLMGNIFDYLFFEQSQLTSTSHAGHIGGLAAGFLFWVIFSRKIRLDTRGASTLPMRRD